MKDLAALQSACRATRSFIYPIVLGGLLAIGCAHTGAYVRNETPMVLDVEPSGKHEFSSLSASVDEEEHQLVVFGRVRHGHEHCLEEGHVDLALVDSAGGVLAHESVSLVNRGAKRGWYGATFRTRIGVLPPARSQLRLRFHDVTCVEGDAYDCGANLALAK